LQDSISKVTRAKWTGDMAHTLEYVLCKHEALSSNPSSTKTKQNKKKTKPKVNRIENTIIAKDGELNMERILFPLHILPTSFTFIFYFYPRHSG
jgi:hypothetical protein